MGDVDVMDHQVVEHAAAEIPVPAPLPESIRIEWLLARGSQPRLPVHRRRIDVVLGSPARGVAIPGQVHFANLAQLSRLHDLVSFLELRHTALLHSDLHDPVVPILRFQCGRPFVQMMRERLFDVHVLARRTSGREHGDVLVIGRGNEHRIDVLAIENSAIVLHRRRVRTRDLLGTTSAWSQTSQMVTIFAPGIWTSARINADTVRRCRCIRCGCVSLAA